MKQIHACRPWLNAELDTVSPDFIVCLGAVTAQSLLGSAFKITQSHGVIQKVPGLPPVMATLHPSAILRAQSHEDRERDTDILVNDLRRATKYLKK
jgi:DNA polymerase